MIRKAGSVEPAFFMLACNRPLPTHAEHFEYLRALWTANVV